MEEKKHVKAVFVNGRPRKKWNTFKMLESAMKGAQEAGAETELVNLYDVDFQGLQELFCLQNQELEDERRVCLEG